MKCHSKYNLLTRNAGHAKAFTIAEVIAAMTLLAMIAVSTMTVINRAMFATMDAELQNQAFEMARENMELLLAADSVEESVEYIESETNPDLQCEIVVEPVLEPVTNQMWIMAICRSTYIDSDDELREIELTSWITKVPKEIAAEILEQQKLEAELEADLEADLQAELAAENAEQGSDDEFEDLDDEDIFDSLEAPGGMSDEEFERILRELSE